MSGDGFTTHAVFWVILLAWLSRSSSPLRLSQQSPCVVAAVNALTQRFQEQKQHETARIFKIAHSNVVFIHTRLKDITVSDQTVVIVGPTPVNTESKELVCVGNIGKKRFKVQLVAKHGNDNCTLRANPAVVTLERGMACGFEVFITPLCSTRIDDKPPLLSKSEVCLRARESQSG